MESSSWNELIHSAAKDASIAMPVLRVRCVIIVLAKTNQRTNLAP
jgi:hypothetical protein